MLHGPNFLKSNENKYLEESSVFIFEAYWGGERNTMEEFSYARMQRLISQAYSAFSHLPAASNL